MLLVDDLLSSPVKGILWIFQEIHKAASEAQAERREDIMAALSALYIALEQGDLSETEFDTREQALLDELDVLDARNGAATDDDEDIDDVEDDDDDAEAGSSRHILDLLPGLRAGVSAGAPDPGPSATTVRGDAARAAANQPVVRPAQPEPEDALS